MWLHEIKHDGFRVIARKGGGRVRLYSRPGNDLTYRFTLIVESLVRLRSRSCIIDGEAVACDGSGIAQINRIRYRSYDSTGLEGIVSKRKDSFAGKHPRGAAPLPRAATRRAGLATDRHDVARGDGELLLIVEDRANSAQDVPHAG